MKKCLFRRHLKRLKFFSALISGGNELKVLHIALKQLLSPYLFSLVVVRYSSDVNRGAILDLVSLMLDDMVILLKYWGACLCKILYPSIESLKLILASTGSQCSLNKTAALLSIGCAPVRDLAVAFRIDLIPFKVTVVEPNNSELQKSSLEVTKACVNISLFTKEMQFLTDLMRFKWKNAFCLRLFIWSDIERALLKTKPRFLTVWAGGKEMSPIKRGEKSLLMSLEIGKNTLFKYFNFANIFRLLQQL